MIGLGAKHDGSYTVALPEGALFYRVRRRRVVYAELALLHSSTLIKWKATRPAVADGIAAGYRMLAEKVVMETDREA